MSSKAFLGEALERGLDLELATYDDVLRHVTTDVLAQYLPRPLWARLLTACLGASKVDAQLVIEAAGIPNLCEHVPAHILWGCIADFAERALGGQVTLGTPRTVPLAAPPPPLVQPSPVVQPSPASTPKSGPIAAIPRSTPARPIPAPAAPKETLSDVFDALEDESKPRPTPISGQRFRQSQSATGVRSTPVSARRPQAAAPVPAAVIPARTPKRSGSDLSDFETDVEFRNGEIAVDDSQLVDWQSSEDTHNGGDRKR